MNLNHYDPKKLKDARKLIGMSLQEVATIIGVDRQTIYRAEAGQSVSYELLASLCGFYRIPMTGIVYPNPPLSKNLSVFV